MSDLLEVRGLSMHFPIHGGILRRQVGTVYAVSDVSFSLREGETLGIVGESGCGKTTLGRTLVRLYAPTAGSIRYRGREIAGLARSDLMELRRELQMVFQDPFSSLNPRMSVGRILSEPLEIHGWTDPDERDRRLTELLELVGLRADDSRRFPHEFSGGQRQRIGIARALALEPGLVVADEPVSALDVSVQAQVLNLLAELQSRLGLTMIFISHDLTVVKYISDRVMVMYLGRVVEVAGAEALYSEPRHPYTRALLRALPGRRDASLEEPRRIEGELPSPSAPPAGCAFHPRCPHASEVCRTDLPTLRRIGESEGHTVACHLADEI